MAMIDDVSRSATHTPAWCAEYKLLDVISGLMTSRLHRFVLLARRRRFWALCRK
jgi:hypothetical protein